jgi:hypothetical protein
MISFPSNRLRSRALWTIKDHSACGDRSDLICTIMILVNGGVNMCFLCIRYWINHNLFAHLNSLEKQGTLVCNEFELIHRTLDGSIKLFAKCSESKLAVCDMCIDIINVVVKKMRSTQG